MTDWAESILRSFPGDGPLVARVTVARDPDGILADEDILAELARRGYLAVVFEDTLALRYQWENAVRSEPARRLVAVMRGGEDAAEVVPWDLRAQCGIEIDLSLESFFPTLDANVLRTLGGGILAKVWDSRYLAAGPALGHRETCEFVFERVLGISPSAVAGVAGFITTMHGILFVNGVSSRPMLDYARAEICAKREFPDDTFGPMISNPARFIDWIQNDWNAYLAVRKEGGEMHVTPSAGVPVVPFDDPTVRRAVSELLRRGLVHGDGTLAGLRVQAEYAGGAAKGEAGLAPFFDDFESRLDQPRTHSDWLALAREWAELEAVALSLPDPDGRLPELRGKIDARFLDWLRTNYAGLRSIPGRRFPVMVHGTVRALAPCVRDGGKAALVVVDGLALHQWVAIRTALQRDFAFDEGASFAWIPTLTSVSRQAIFSGKAPFEFASTFETTNAERREWVGAWSEECPELAQDAVYYNRGLASTERPAAADLAAVPPSARVCGLVVNRVDDMMHGETLGAANFLSQVSAWAGGGYLRELVEGLLERGFTVALTSDHGNVGATGTGTIREGVVADTKGERVRVYSAASLRDAAARKAPESVAWTNAGLPPDRFALLAGGCDAFLKEGEPAIAHGGASIDEVVVPFVWISRK